MTTTSKVSSDVFRTDIIDAFFELHTWHGWHAAANIGLGQTDALHILEERGVDKKYVYYHWQDDERIDDQLECWIGYCCDSDTKELVRILKKYVQVEWNGELNERIKLLPKPRN
jgi:hypothetical protein